MEILWKSEYELGIKVIDSQHRQLIALINQLLKAHEAAKFSFIIESIFNDLLSYCNYHFSLEESIMREKFYHDYDNHKEMHDMFFKKINILKTNYANGKPMALMNTINYLNDWLIEHIMVEDHKYVDCIKSST